jgi:hypothetical protein
MTYPATVIFGNKVFTADVPIALPLQEFFRLYILPRHNINRHDYLLYDGSRHEFDQAPIASLHPHGSLILLSKRQFSELETFVSRHLPSAVETACQLPDPRASTLVRLIHSTHALAKQHSEDEVLAVCSCWAPVFEGDEIDADIDQLLQWFTGEFFKVVSDPPCRLCTRATSRVEEPGPVTPAEREASGSYALRYKCQSCGATTRFVRYNSVLKQLEAKEGDLVVGHAVECANVFCAILMAAGVDARLVFLSEDCVWVEYWSRKKNIYVHVDPVKNVRDRPLIYEEGGAEIGWVIAVGRYEIEDVTRRYTQNFGAVVDARSRIVDEQWLAFYLNFLKLMFQVGIDDATKRAVSDRLSKDTAFLHPPQ